MLNNAQGDLVCSLARSGTVCYVGPRSDHSLHACDAAVSLVNCCILAVQAGVRYTPSNAI
jgi:hypothetical protein